MRWFNDRRINEKNNLTAYRLAKETGIPYTTVNDICTGKREIKNCKVETAYLLSKRLGTSMEMLYESETEQKVERIDFELFKSNVCHKVKRLGDKKFIVETLENDIVQKYYQKKWYPESFYFLAMVDYLSRINNIPLCREYEYLRKLKLPKTIYPTGVLCVAAVSGNDDIKEQAKKDSIPEFLHYNIVEGDIRDAV